MKKTVCVILAIVMLCGTFAACKKSETKAPDDTAQQGEESAQTSEPDELEEPKKEFTVGVRTDNSYTSECLGLVYTLPDNMIMATDEEIFNMMDIGADMMYKDEETGQKKVDYAKLNIIYEMMAVRADYLGSIIVVAEKLAFSGITEEQYVLALKSQFEQMDMTVTYQDTTSKEVGGVTFFAFPYTMETDGAIVNQLMLLKKISNYFMVITVTYSDDAMLDELLSNFSPLEQ